MDPYREAIEERIAELWRYRQWWRDNRWADWPIIRFQTDHELRSLVHLARAVRKAERARLKRELAIVEEMFRGDHFRFPAGVGR